jgi:hypothetical protein
LHVDALVHAVAAPHCVPAATGVWVTPVDGSHASAVHGFPSSTMGGVVVTHAPLALQVPTPVHAFPPEHDEPVGAGVWSTPPCAPHESCVHGLLSEAATEPSSARTVTVSWQIGMMASTCSSNCAPLTVLPAPGRSRWRWPRM